MCHQLVKPIKMSAISNRQCCSRFFVSGEGKVGMEKDISFCFSAIQTHPNSPDHINQLPNQKQNILNAKYSLHLVIAQPAGCCI